MTVNLTSQTLREDVYSDGSVRVDREAGLIRGVKIIGLESKNRRRYSVDALREAMPLYEGVSVFVDHPDREKEHLDRSVSDKAGWLENVSLRGDGLYGDLNLLLSDSRSAKVLEVADRNPKILGLSHHAIGDGSEDTSTGEFVVESIVQLNSVDIVSTPATTRGLFESDRSNPVTTTTKKVTKRKVRDILESHKSDGVSKRVLKVLTEMPEMGPVADEVVEAPAEDPNAEVEAAMEKAAVSIVKKLFAGDVEANDAFKKIRELLGMKDKASDDAGGEPPAEPMAESVRDLMAEVKQLKAERLREQVLADNGFARRDLTESQRKLLAKQNDEDDMRELVESWPRPTATTGRSVTRPAIGSARRDSRRETVTESYKDLKKRIRPSAKKRR